MSASAKYFQPDVLSRISRLELRARHVVEGFVSGMHKSPYKGFSVEFANHRPYAPGDDIRHIDWRAYAKADRFYIKEYEEETNMRVHILLDCSASMAYPEHPNSDRMNKWDYAATVAASLAHLLVYQQDGVGLTLFDADIVKQLPVSTSRSSLVDFVNVIEAAGPGNKTDMKTVLPRVASQIPRRGMVVVISDLLADVDELVRGLQRFSYGKHDVLILHVLDQDEIEFPFAERTLFEGMEDVDQRVLTDPQSLRRDYLEALEAYLGRIRRACLDNRIDYALLNTGEGMDVALSTFLATRMHRRRATA